MTTIQRRLVSALVVMATLSLVSSFVVEVIRWIRLPVFLDNTEIYIAYGIRSLATEGVLYRDLSHLPLVVHVYQPLTYLPAAAMLGLPWVNRMELLPAIRVLNPPILLATLFVVYRIARRLAGSRDVAWLTVLAAVSLQAVFFAEIIRIRPDNGAVLMTLCALLLAVERPRGWWLWTAAAIGVANFFKPSFIALPAAIVLRLLAEGDWRTATRFAAACSVIFAGLVAAAFAAFGPDYLIQTFRFSIANPDLPIWNAPALLLVWLMLLGPVVLAMLAGAGALVRRDGATSLLAIYLLTSTSTALFGLMKTGADIHYLVEVSFALLLAFVAALPRPGGTRVMAAFCALAVTFEALRSGAPGVTICAHRHGNRDTCHYTSPLPSRPELAREVASGEPGAVVFDEVLAFETGRVVALDWTLLDLLVRSRSVDPTPLFALIERPTTTHVVFSRRANFLLDVLYQKALSAGFTPVPDGGDRVLARPLEARANSDHGLESVRRW